MPPTTLQPLAPDAAPLTAREFLDGLSLRDGGRTRVAAVMIATVDGRAAIEGRSVKLGHPADRALLRELRATADAILVGARTLAAERYADLLDPGHVEDRRARGQADHPLVATISRQLDLARDVPLLAEDVPIRVYSEVDGDGPFEVRRMAPVSVRAVIADLELPLVVCEGGPRLLRELVAEDLVDDLFITVSPLLAAGDAPAPLTGDALAEPHRLRLGDVLRADDHLFLHYVR